MMYTAAVIALYTPYAYASSSPAQMALSRKPILPARYFLSMQDKNANTNVEEDIWADFEDSGSSSSASDSSVSKKSTDSKMPNVSKKSTDFKMSNVSKKSTDFKMSNVSKKSIDSKMSNVSKKSTDCSIESNYSDNETAEVAEALKDISKPIEEYVAEESLTKDISKPIEEYTGSTYTMLNPKRGYRGERFTAKAPCTCTMNLEAGELQFSNGTRFPLLFAYNQKELFCGIGDGFLYVRQESEFSSYKRQEFRYYPEDMEQFLRDTKVFLEDLAEGQLIDSDDIGEHFDLYEDIEKYLEKQRRRRRLTTRLGCQ